MWPLTHALHWMKGVTESLISLMKAGGKKRSSSTLLCWLHIRIAWFRVRTFPFTNVSLWLRTTQLRLIWWCRQEIFMKASGILRLTKRLNKQGWLNNTWQFHIRSPHKTSFSSMSVFSYAGVPDFLALWHKNQAQSHQLQPNLMTRQVHKHKRPTTNKNLYRMYSTKRFLVA